MAGATKENQNGKEVIPPLLGSCRLTITLMFMVLSFGAIVMTINLGMAIVCMKKRSLTVNSTEMTGVNNCSANYEYQTPSTCTDVSVAMNQDAPDWDKRAQGMLLGATYYGVVSVQILVGWLSDKYGKTKLQMICGSGLMGLASLISPLIIRFTPVPFYFAVRILIGVAMCFALSSVLPMLNRWKTEREQGLLVGLSFAGIGIANSVTYPISGLLCEYSGWQSIFYFAGCIGILWSIAALFLIYDTPLVHPRISGEEKQYLLNSQKKVERHNIAIPWKKILTSIPVWSVISTNFFFFAAQKGTVLNLPLYNKDVLDFTVTENGIFSSMPLVLALIIHLITGPLFDYVRARSFCSLTIVRKIFHVIGTIIPAAMMFAVSQMNSEEKYAIISLITVGFGFHEVAIMGGFAFVLLDIAPDFVGILQGINNTIGLAPGFIIPMIVSALTPEGTREEWSHVFLLFGGLYSLAMIIFVISGSAELLSWGKAKETSSTKDEEKQLEKLVA